MNLYSFGSGLQKHCHFVIEPLKKYLTYKTKIVLVTMSIPDILATHILTYRSSDWATARCLSVGLQKCRSVN